MWLAELDGDEDFLALLVKDEDDNWELTTYDREFEETEVQTFYSKIKAEEWVEEHHGVSDWKKLPSDVNLDTVVEYLEDQFGSAA